MMNIKRNKVDSFDGWDNEANASHDNLGRLIE